MTIYLPGWMWIAAAAALILFYAANRSNRNRRRNMHTRFKEKQEELMEILKAKEKKGDTAEEKSDKDE